MLYGVELERRKNINGKSNTNPNGPRLHVWKLAVALKSNKTFCDKTAVNMK